MKFTSVLPDEQFSTSQPVQGGVLRSLQLHTADTDFSPPIRKKIQADKAKIVNVNFFLSLAPISSPTSTPFNHSRVTTPKQLAKRFAPSLVL